MILADATNALSEAWSEYQAANLEANEAKDALKIAQDEKDQTYEKSESPAARAALTRKVTEARLNADAKRGPRLKQ